MKKRLIITIILLLIVFGGIFTWDALRSYGMKKYFEHQQIPPVTVSTEIAQAQNWHPKLNAVGSLTAVNGVNVSGELSGIVDEIHFVSGQKVNEGDLLVKLRDYVDQATLKHDQAALKLAAVTYQRTQYMYEKQLLQKQTLDESQAKLEEAEAAVQHDQEVINQKHIRAPFTGIIGIRQVNLGQYLSAGTAIATLQALDPLFVDFTLPEQSVSQLSIGQPLQVAVESYPKEIFKGSIIAINPKIDEDTRTISVRGLIQNLKQLLYPGNFAQVQVILPQQENIVTVPQNAIDYSLYGNTIYVLAPTSEMQNGQSIYMANQELVKVGLLEGTKVQILSGIKAGDLIVTTGQIKLSNKVPVTINNAQPLQQTMKNETDETE